jgi:hypothetical protein
MRKKRTIMRAKCFIVPLAIWVFTAAFVIYPICPQAAEDERGGGGGQPGVEMVLLEIELPIPQFIGTPKHIRSSNLGRITGKPRGPFMAPEGTVNLASGREVSGSDEEPIIGELEMLTDSDKEGVDGSFVELGPGRHYIQVDLEAPSEIYAVVVWHFHSQARVYFDVICQLSETPEFPEGVRTIFNNDHDNSSGLGKGSDKEYIETFDGKLFNGKGSRAQYIRLYSKGNTGNDLNHYIEVEVYGKPIK